MKLIDDDSDGSVHKSFCVLAGIIVLTVVVLLLSAPVVVRHGAGDVAILLDEGWRVWNG